jgi:hypothetical protein
VFNYSIFISNVFCLNHFPTLHLLLCILLSISLHLIQNIAQELIYPCLVPGISLRSSLRKLHLRSFITGQHLFSFPEWRLPGIFSKTFESYLTKIRLGGFHALLLFSVPYPYWCKSLHLGWVVNLRCPFRASYPRRIVFH